MLIKQLEEQAEQEPGETTIDSFRNSVIILTLCSVHLDFNNVVKSTEAFNKGINTVSRWEECRPADTEASTFRAVLLHLHAQGLTAEHKDADAKQVYLEALAIRRGIAGDPDADLATKVDAVAAVADSLDGLERVTRSRSLCARKSASFATRLKRRSTRKTCVPPGNKLSVSRSLVLDVSEGRPARHGLCDQKST